MRHPLMGEGLSARRSFRYGNDRSIKSRDLIASCDLKVKSFLLSISFEHCDRLGVLRGKRRDWCAFKLSISYSTLSNPNILRTERRVTLHPSSQRAHCQSIRWLYEETVHSATLRSAVAHNDRHKVATGSTNWSFQVALTHLPAYPFCVISTAPAREAEGQCPNKSQTGPLVRQWRSNQPWLAPHPRNPAKTCTTTLKEMAGSSMPPSSDARKSERPSQH